MPEPKPGPFAVVIDGVRYDRFTDASVDMSIESVGFSFSGNAFVPYGQLFPFERFGKCEVFYQKERLFSAILEQPIDGYRQGGSSTQINGGSKTMALAYSYVPPGQRGFSGRKLHEIVKELASPHGISVSVMTGVDQGKPFTKFPIAAGSTVVNAISEACSARSLLCFTTDGDSLVIGRPINNPAAYTLPSEKVRVESANNGGESTQIGSTYIVVGGGNVNGKQKRSVQLDNPAVSLFRPVVIHATRGKTQEELEAIVRRALRAREGRAVNVQLRTPQWVDQFGKVFRAGTMVHVKDKHLRTGKWKHIDETLVISDVNLQLGQDGLWATLRLKRPDAYAEE